VHGDARSDRWLAAKLELPVTLVGGRISHLARALEGVGRDERVLAAGAA
jgi:hypothetical protein